MNISVRKYNNNDNDSVIKLYYQIDNQHYQKLPDEFLEPIKIIRDNKYFENIISSNDSILFVAEIDNLIVGLIEVYIKQNTTIVSNPIKIGYIYAIVVDENYRREGIGKKLLSEAKEWLKSNEVKRVDLRVYDFNNEAMKFFSNYEFNIQSYFLTSKL